MTFRRRSRISVTVLLLILGALFVLLPLFWLLFTAFQQPINAQAIPPHWLARPTLQNFHATVGGSFGHSLLNSAIVAFGSTAIALVLGVPAGYALARSKVPGARFINAWFILAYVAPPVVFIVPLYVIYQHFNLLDTYQGLIIAYETGLLPFTIWLMRVYFSDVPRDLDEAAWIDGCSKLRALWRVVLPCAWPGVTTVGLLVALASWGEYFAAVILTGPRTQTAPVGINSYLGGMSMSSNWGYLAASALMVVVPALAATIAVQRGLIRGIAHGAVKQ
jgi:ABC-type glycerol-3-phosphate transport system permease component